MEFHAIRMHNVHPCTLLLICQRVAHEVTRSHWGPSSLVKGGFVIAQIFPTTVYLGVVLSIIL